MPQTDILTQAQILTAFANATGGAVPAAPLTYVSIEGVAIGTPVVLDNGWVLTATQTGTDLSVTVDETTNTNIVGVDGLPPYAFDNPLLKFTDANGVEWCMRIPLEAVFEYQAAPPEGVDDTDEIVPGGSALIDVLANDPSEVDFPVVGTVLHGTLPTGLTVVPDANTPFEHNVSVAATVAPASTLVYQYCIDYGGGTLSDPIDVTIVVPDTPEGVDDAQTIDAGTNADVTVTSNDGTDPDYPVVGTVVHGTPPSARTTASSAPLPEPVFQAKVFPAI